MVDGLDLEVSLDLVDPLGSCCVCKGQVWSNGPMQHCITLLYTCVASGAASYNKREEDFPSLREYNDYLEDIEEISKDASITPADIVWSAH